MGLQILEGRTVLDEYTPGLLATEEKGRYHPGFVVEDPDYSYTDHRTEVGAVLNAGHEVTTGSTPRSQ